MKYKDFKDLSEANLWLDGAGLTIINVETLQFGMAGETYRFWYYKNI